MGLDGLRKHLLDTITFIRILRGLRKQKVDFCLNFERIGWIAPALLDVQSLSFSLGFWMDYKGLNRNCWRTWIWLGFLNCNLKGIATSLSLVLQEAFSGITGRPHHRWDFRGHWWCHLCCLPRLLHSLSQGIGKMILSVFEHSDPKGEFPFKCIFAVFWRHLISDFAQALYDKMGGSAPPPAPMECQEQQFDQV